MNNRVYSKNNRIEILDVMRGASMIFVVVYHLIYDLIYFVGINIPFFYSKTMNIIHIFFLIILFTVSGISTTFSRNSLRRGVVLYLLGEGITILTSIFMPDGIIVFGVISYIGMSMMLYEFLREVLDKISWKFVYIVSMMLYFITYRFPQGELNFLFYKMHIDLPTNLYYLYPIGIKAEGFMSTDYFPLIPFFFVFLGGTALAKPIANNRFPKWFYNFKNSFLSIIGKRSLIIYVLHQPIFLGVIFLLT